MTKLLDGNVSVQNFFQANIGYTHNHAENNNTFNGLVNWNYGLHYQFRITENFKLLAGALADINGGSYTTCAIRTIRLRQEHSSIWMLLQWPSGSKIKNYPLTFRYQVNVPVVGAMFSPHYGQSYYEIFTLGNSDGVIQFTSLHNQPSVRQMLSIDFPVRYAKLRFSYMADLQQSDVNNIKTHTYSHVFMVGFVKDLYLIRNKNGTPLPAAVRAY